MMEAADMGRTPLGTNMPEIIETIIPGRAPIELVAFYDEFRNYYPLCELETKRWFVDNVQPDWWIFDIGANVGYYSILFAQLAPQGRVISFEPTSTAGMLRTNLAHNAITNVEVHQVALGATTGVQRDRIFRLWGGEGDIQEYPFYRFDDFVAEHRPARIDCMKIDVDSFDFEVLRGAEKTLQVHNPLIVIELNHALAKRNQSAGEALAWLAEHGYRQALVLDHDNFVLQRDRDYTGTTALSLVFPPPLRFDESLDAIAGSEIASPLHLAAVQSGSSVAGALAAPAGGPGLTDRLRVLGRQIWKRDNIGQGKALTISSLVGRTIETSDRTWSYAVVVTADTDSPPPALGNNAVLAFEVAVEVTQGKLGVALCGADPSQFIAPERILLAMKGVQRVLVSGPAHRIRSLVFRTAAPEGSRTVFSLFDVKVKVKSAAPTQPTSQMRKDPSLRSG
jgi:FkbM family methyltransferase